MKKTLFIIALGAMSLSAMSQAITFSEVPSSAPATTALRMPSGTSAQTTIRGHYIIPASEINIPAGTVFSGLGFSCTEGTNTSASGNIVLYLQNTNDVTNSKSTTWTTAIGSMTNVYNGIYNIPTGSSPGNVDLTLQTSFTYTGGGIYVAYDYLGSTFSTSAANYVANNDLAGSLYMDQSNTTTPPATVTTATAFRPQTRFFYPNTVANDIAVLNVGTKHGYENKLYATNNTINALIQNKSNIDKTNIIVSLALTGVNPYNSTITIPSLLAGDTTTVSFTGLSLANLGIQNIEVSVPVDDNITNNLKEQIQNVSCTLLGYAGDAIAYDGIGFNTSSGIVAVKYTSPMVEASLTGLLVNINNAASNSGKPITGVLLDAAGAILATSPVTTIANADLGANISLNFTTPVNIPAATDFYVGVLQNASSGFYPVGTAEPVITPPGMYYSFPVSGGTATNYTDLGNLMIRAILDPVTTLTASTTDAVCEGTEVDYTASGAFGSFDFSVNAASSQNSTANVFRYAPANNDIVSVLSILNGCTATASVAQADVKPAPLNTVTKNDMTLTAVEENATYQWVDCNNSNTPIVGATQQSYTATEDGSYAVIITDSNGECSSISDCQVVSTIGLDNNPLQSVSVFPNPGSGIFTLQTTESIENTTFSIYSYTGKLLFEQVGSTGNTVTVDLTQYATGVYLLKVKNKAGVGIKLIKQ